MQHVATKTAQFATQITAATALGRPIPINVKRHGRKGPVKFKATTSNLALAAAIDALAVAIAVEEPLAKAHTAAELSGDARAEEAADRKWQRQRRLVDRAAEAMLAVPVDNAADALVQQNAYRWSYKERGCLDIWDQQEAEASLAAATRALQKLAAPVTSAPPPTPIGDIAARNYIAAKQDEAHLAHDGGSTEDQNLAHERMTAAATAMLSTQPADLQGVAARLGYIVSQGFLHRAGDWDCPRCEKREEIVPPTDDEFVASGEGDNGGADALFRALAFLHQGVERLAAQQPTAAAKAWYAARADYLAARAASDAADDDRSDQTLDDVAEAMERWETMPPPTLAAMVEVMLASLDFNGMAWVYQKTSQPDAWRDLLDAGDTHEIFAARYTLHAMRLTGIDHPARAVVPTAGYRAPFDEAAHESGPEMEAAWRAHHAQWADVRSGPAAVYGAEYLIAAE